MEPECGRWSGMGGQLDAMSEDRRVSGASLGVDCKGQVMNCPPYGSSILPRHLSFALTFLDFPLPLGVSLKNPSLFYVLFIQQVYLDGASTVPCGLS